MVHDTTIYNNSNLPTMFLMEYVWILRRIAFVLVHLNQVLMSVQPLGFNTTAIFQQGFRMIWRHLIRTLSREFHSGD